MYQNLMFRLGTTKEIKNRYLNDKKVFENFILKDKRNIRSVLITRLMLQHEVSFDSILFLMRKKCFKNFIVLRKFSVIPKYSV
jgi:hypothetical protein